MHLCRLMNTQINNIALELSLLMDTYFIYNEYIFPFKKYKLEYKIINYINKLSYFI